MDPTRAWGARGSSAMDQSTPDPTMLDPPKDLEWHDAIRSRPHMYLGDGGTLGTLYLLSSLLECPLAPSALLLTLDSGAIRIQATCLPPAVEARAADRPAYFVEICTRINAPLDNPPTIAALEVFDADAEPPAFKRSNVAPPYLTIANALSARFQISSITDGIATRASFERGVLTSGPTAETTESPDGLDLHIVFDAIPTHGDFGKLGAFGRFDLVAELAREIANVRGVPVTVVHRTTERRFTATPRVG
jgi:hypothetical protein